MAHAISSYLEGKIAKWWIPDDVVFVDTLTYGVTGKVQKMELRQRPAGHCARAAAIALRVATK
jgi:acyl-CoA synthetase (AMP-forming)/AMP-acid ligase II